MKPVKLLVADVDGTLVTSDKRLTARACDAVAHLRAAGVAFVITSGRPPRGMAMLIEPLGVTTPVAAFNGGLLVAPDLTTVITQRTLPLAVAVETLEVLLASGLDAWVYRGSDWFVRDTAAPHVAREEKTVQFAPTVTRDLKSVLDGAVKIVGVSDDEPRIVACEAELRRRVGEHASAARSQPYYLDVTHPEANKGTVVREMSERLDVAPSEIAAIGDMPNDVLMFAVAGVSIAMGNASREVQRAARYVTTPNDDEGFANAVERIILGAPPSPASLGLPMRTRACLFDVDVSGGGAAEYARAAGAAGLRTAVVAQGDYLAAARSVDVAPADAAVFVATSAAVVAARAAGLGYIVAVAAAADGKALHHDGADVVVADLAELLVNSAPIRR